MNQLKKEPSRFLIREEYRNSQMIVTALAGDYLGEVSLWGEVIYRHSSQGVDSLIQQLRTWLDQYYQREALRRSGEPSQQAYVQAVKRIYDLLTPVQQQLIRYHSSCNAFAVPVERLLSEAGVCSHIQLLLEYASIARRLSDALFYIPTETGSLVDPVLTVLLQAIDNESIYQQATLALAIKAGKAFEI